MQNIKDRITEQSSRCARAMLWLGMERVSQNKARLLVRSPSAFSTGKIRKAFLSQRAATDYMFDWRALHPWGIKESDLPAGECGSQPATKLLESPGFPGA